MFKILFTVLLLISGFSFAQTNNTNPYVDLILDLSGSMWLELPSGEFKIDAAKTALNDLIVGMDETQVNMGLRVYGATVSGIDPLACTDSQQLMPILGLDKEKLLATIEASEPKGGTPIAFTLNEAIKDFSAVPASAQKTIILVTDGQESCGQDLTAVIEELRRNNIALQVIGFGLSERATKAFEGLAFVNTFNTVELTTALSETMMDLSPVKSQTQAVVETSQDYDVSVDITVTPNSQMENIQVPDNQFDVNVDILVAPNNTLTIVDVAGPRELKYSRAATTYFLNWEGAVSYPITVVLKDLVCGLSTQDGNCVFASTPVQSPMNPIPLAITCPSVNSDGVGYWRNEIKLVDSNGVESPPYVLEIRCVS